MASLREIRNRIKSVRSSEKITKAMTMVAASKFRKAQENLKNSRSYSNQINNMITKMQYENSKEYSVCSLLKPRQERNIELLIMTSDRGLCGAFNTNIIRKVQSFLKEYKAHNILENKIQLSTFGHKGYEIFKKENMVIRKNYSHMPHVYSDYLEASKIVSELESLYKHENLDAVYVAYNEFNNISNQKIIIKKLMPIIIQNDIAEKNIDTDFNSIDFIFEPTKQKILKELLPKYLTAQLFQALLESAASEHGARMTAMDNATRNAKEVIENLTLKYNRARQASITNELIEILSGAEALR